MRRTTSWWWPGAVVLGLSLASLARPAAGQEDQAAPAGPPPPRGLTTGHPLASRDARGDSGRCIAAAGDTLRAAAIRTRLSDRDFQPGERIWMRVDSEPALSETTTVTTAGTVALPSPVNHEIPFRGVLRSELQ